MAAGELRVPADVVTRAFARIRAGYRMEKAEGSGDGTRDRVGRRDAATLILLAFRSVRGGGAKPDEIVLVGQIITTNKRKTPQIGSGISTTIVNPT